MVVIGKPADLHDLPDGATSTPGDPSPFHDPVIAAPRPKALDVLLPIVFAGGYMGIGGINVMLVVFTGPKIADDPHGFSEETVSVGTSMLYLGWALASLFVMPLSDKVGRKPILYFMEAVGMVSVSCSLLAQSPFFYMLALFGTGFFSAASVLGFLLCQELIPSEMRTLNNSVLNVFFCLFVICIAVLSTKFTSDWDWRAETAFWYSPHLFLTLCGPWVISESPSFRTGSTDLPAELPARADEPVANRTEDGTLEPPQDPSRDGGAPAVAESAFSRLTGAELRGTTLLTCFCWSATVVGYYGLTYSAGNLSDDVSLNTVLLLSIDIFALFVASPVVTAWGAKRVQAVAFTGIGLMLCILSFVPSDSSWVLAGVLCGRFCVDLDFFTVYLLVMEHFPAECCSTAFGWANFTSRVAGMMAPLCSLMSTHMTFLLIGTLTVLASVATCFLPGPPKVGQATRSSLAPSEAADRGFVGRTFGYFKGLMATLYVKMPENESEQSHL